MGDELRAFFPYLNCVFNVHKSLSPIVVMWLLSIVTEMYSVCGCMVNYDAMPGIRKAKPALRPIGVSFYGLSRFCVKIPLS